MCGIAGFVGAEVGEAGLRKMIEAQHHRGPDHGDVWIKEFSGGTIGLGNRRLAVLDPSPLGHQPMHNPETGDVLVYNGEIYNFRILRQELESYGYRFKSQTDTEVILRGYEQWGTSIVEHLSGMFAFALWDESRRFLFLARDPLGIKPLYYSETARGFVFASEIRAILCSGAVSCRIEPNALTGYLAYGSVQEPYTILSQVYSLQAGSWLQVDLHGNELARKNYWKLPEPETEHEELPELVEKGKELFQRSVKRHLISDVPVGVFLSSGLDSTAVLGSASRVASEEMHAFTVSFSDDEQLDEAPTARRTAERIGVTYHECRVDQSTALDWIEQALNSMDQPTMDGMNTYIVSRAVRERGIVVALSGQGGDEVFGGYRSFRVVPRWQRGMKWLNRLAPSFRAALAGAATSFKSTVAQEKASDVAHAGADFLALYFQFRRLVSNEDLDLLTGSSSKRLDPFLLSPAINPEELIVTGDPEASIRRLETAFYLRNTLLRDGDVFGMANSLEIRVPFLDRDLVEWAFRLPGKIFLPPNAPYKHLLRKMFVDFYTEEMLHQPKRGFTAPFSLWLNGALRNTMEESLATLRHSGLVNPKGVIKIHQAFLNEPKSAAWSRVWGLVALGYWLNRTQSAYLPTT